MRASYCINQQEIYDMPVGNLASAMDMAKRSFTASPFETTIERYREVRQLAQQLDRWDGVRSELLAYVKQSHKTDIEIEIALDEGHSMANA